MLLPSLLLTILAGTTVLPGTSVDSPVDDRQVFSKLEAETTALAEKDVARLTRDLRLEQCRRTRTAGLTLGLAGVQTLPGADLYRRGAEASVLIGTAYKCDKCTKWHHSHASGFAVSADGVIATNHHVAASATGEAMGVLTADGRFFPVVEVLATDKAHDVALLRIDAAGLAFLPLRDDAPAGSAIYCYSHPANTYGCFSEGIITRYFKMNEPERSGAVFLQITADYARGSSGGPVMDTFGNAVGIVASTSVVFTTPPAIVTGGKATKPVTPSQQMVRHNCATARALRNLISVK